MPADRRQRVGDWLVVNSQRQVDACVEWPFAKHRKGHGIFRKNGKAVYAHREVCRQAHGEPRPGQLATHTCGNAGCVNARHLRWADHAANMKDMVRHGTSIRGERNHFARFTAKTVLAIRKSAASDTDLARKYGVARGTIYCIRIRRSWKHL